MGVGTIWVAWIAAREARRARELSEKTARAQQQAQQTSERRAVAALLHEWANRWEQSATPRGGRVLADLDHLLAVEQTVNTSGSLGARLLYQDVRERLAEADHQGDEYSVVLGVFRRIQKWVDEPQAVADAIGRERAEQDAFRQENDSYLPFYALPIRPDGLDGSA